MLAVDKLQLKLLINIRNEKVDQMAKEGSIDLQTEAPVTCRQMK